MFDLSDMRATVFDHLASWGVYRVSQPLETLDGRAVPAGKELTFEYARVNINTGEARAYFHDEQGMEYEIPTHRNRISAEFEKLGRESRPLKSSRTMNLTSPPPPNPQRWLAWLAEQPDWEGAAKTMGQATSLDPRAEADTLLWAARAFRPFHPEIARWLADRSQTLYYTWTAQATSGGEGTAMQSQIRSQLAELEDILNP